AGTPDSCRGASHLRPGVDRHPFVSTDVRTRAHARDSGRGCLTMKRIITIIAALLFALTTVPALAAPGDIDTRVLTDNAGTMIFLGQIEATDNGEADFMVRVFDESMIEDSFDGMVVMSDALD